MNEYRGGSGGEAAVRRVVEDWASAVRKRDPAAVLRNYSTDILMFDVPRGDRGLQEDLGRSRALAGLERALHQGGRLGRPKRCRPRSRTPSGSI